MDGKGVLPDDAEAARWFLEAAAQGIPDARFRLAQMYVQGHGVPQDDLQAYVWFDVVASLTSASGKYPHELHHQMAVSNLDRVAETMTAAQLADAQRLAKERKQAQTQ
jgi:TPR repeat protein